MFKLCALGCITSENGPAVVFADGTDDMSLDVKLCCAGVELSLFFFCIKKLHSVIRFSLKFVFTDPICMEEPWGDVKH